MKYEKPEDFIFPTKSFNPEIINKYSEYLIEIPTGRKNEKNEEEKIPCLFKKYPKSNYLLISFHCNGINMFSSFDTISKIAKKFHFNCLVPEFPGYSLYNYPKDSQKCLDNSLIIYDFAINNIKNISEKNIFVFGRSLGTGPATYLASKRNPAAVILLSPYTTFAEVARNYHEKDFYDKLTKHLRSIDYIDKIKIPLCIIHGNDDKLIDCSEAKKLYEKCTENNNKELHFVDKMGHNDIFFYLGEMKEIIENFLNKHCPVNKPNKDESEIELKLDKKYFYNSNNNEDNDKDINEEEEDMK